MSSVGSTSSFAQSARFAFAANRAAIGVASWFAPDFTVKFFGIDPAKSDRFVGRLFGARELALAATLAFAPPAALRTTALIGAVVDTVDSIAGFDERRRGNLSIRATILGPVGAAGFALLGLYIAREADALVAPASVPE